MSDSGLENHKQLVRRLIDELITGGKLEIADELMSGELAKKTSDRTRLLRTAFPDLTLQIKELIAEADKVACHWTASGTQAGPIMGVPATKAKASWTGTSFYTIVDNKIVDTTDNWDSLELLQQLRTAMQRGKPG